MATTKKDNYKLIADQIINAVQSTGQLPWQKPWKGGNGPKNLRSKKLYRGINIWILSMIQLANAYASPYWVTFKQAQEMGGTVKKGQKGTKIVFWKIVRKQNDNDETESFPVLRVYTVFNTDQCEGLEDKIPTPEVQEVAPLDAAEAVLASYLDRPEVKHGGDRACYSPFFDHVQMPPREAFTSMERYYSTLFHELAHSTGHKDRLNRDLSGLFGDHSYSNEELIAEFTAAFLCGEAGIDNATVDNSAAYIQSWLKVLKNDPKMLVSAAQSAQKAADYITGATREVALAEAA